MKSPRALLLLAAIAFLPLTAEDGATPLCNGRDLTGWTNPYEWGKTEVVGDEIDLTAEKKFFLEHEAESQAFFKRPEIAGALKRNDWNHVRITAKGNSIEIELNGVVTTEYTDDTDDTDAKGHLGIQHHGEKGQTYRFRNLSIKPL